MNELPVEFEKTPFEDFLKGVIETREATMGVCGECLNVLRKIVSHGIFPHRFVFWEIWKKYYPQVLEILKEARLDFEIEEI